MANSGDGYAYLTSNIGMGTPNVGDGFGYAYENVGMGTPNVGDGFGYAYENITLYVIASSDKMPPMIN
jgi:hypothetical protein